MLRPSFIPGRPRRQLRDLTRYRRTLVQERTREKQRAEKLLEDAQVKLSSVISDIFGASGRDMLAALIAGQRNPRALADLAHADPRHGERPAGGAHRALHRSPRVPAGHDARPRRRAHRPDRRPHHPDRAAIAPCARQVAQLDEIPGIGVTAAQEIIAEIGTDMTRFPTPGHLVSWAKFAPKARQSAGRSKAAATGKGTLARRHHRRGRCCGRPDQHLPGFPLQADRQTTRQETRPGRRRQLHPHHRLAPVI